MTARRTVLVLASLLSVAAPAHALLATGPLSAPAGGCVHDLARTGAGDPLCAHVTPGLGAPAALAVDGDRLFVAAAGSGAVTALTLHGTNAVAQAGPSPRAGDCVVASGTACSRIVRGLAGVDALAVSPDGRDLYAGSADGRAVVGLTAATLVPIAGGCVAHLAHHLCPATTPLASVGGLAMSPDGHNVYVASFGEAAGADTLVALTRSVRTGALKVDAGASCIASLGRAAVACPTRVAGLEGLTAAIVTADGRFVYAASPTSSAVVGFIRNRFSGRLTALGGAGGCLRDATTNNSGNQGCATATPGLRGARGLALSPDGRTLFVIASDPGSVVALARNPGTGALTPRPGGCLSATATLGCETVTGLRGAQAGAVADHGGQLVVAALGADAVLALAIDPTSGVPAAPDATIRDLGTLSGPAAIAAGDGGPAIYVASALDDSVATLTDAGAGANARS
jgi:DNA-binding beta-propeller fold protein YncE